MSAIDWLKKSYLLQDMVCWWYCRTPAPVHHNLEKIKALRKAFAFTGHEAVGGDYFEFGVFQGTSMMAAVQAYRYQDKFLGQEKEQERCRFFGFDSFEGVNTQPDVDGAHPIYDRPGVFDASYEKTVRRFRRFRKKYDIHLIKGRFKDTLPTLAWEKLGVCKARVVLIDCDLKSSTADALKHSAPFWQQGTVLIFDDIFSYRGVFSEGESGAFAEFCERHPKFCYRDFGQYGINGQLKIVSQTPH